MEDKPIRSKPGLKLAKTNPGVFVLLSPSFVAVVPHYVTSSVRLHLPPRHFVFVVLIGAHEVSFVLIFQNGLPLGHQFL